MAHQGHKWSWHGGHSGTAHHPGAVYLYLQSLRCFPLSCYVSIPTGTAITLDRPQTWPGNWPCLSTDEVKHIPSSHKYHIYFEYITLLNYHRLNFYSVSTRSSITSYSMKPSTAKPNLHVYITLLLTNALLLLE